MIPSDRHPASRAWLLCLPAVKRLPLALSKLCLPCAVNVQWVPLSFYWQNSIFQLCQDFKLLFPSLFSRMSTEYGSTSVSSAHITICLVLVLVLVLYSKEASGWWCAYFFRLSPKWSPISEPFAASRTIIHALLHKHSFCSSSSTAISKYDFLLPWLHSVLLIFISVSKEVSFFLKNGCCIQPF